MNAMAVLSDTASVSLNHPKLLNLRLQIMVGGCLKPPPPTPAAVAGRVPSADAIVVAARVVPAATELHLDRRRQAVVRGDHEAAGAQGVLHGEHDWYPAAWPHSTVPEPEPKAHAGGECGCCGR